MSKSLVGKQVIEYAKKLQEKGAQNVLVSMGSKGAIFLDENGYLYTLKIDNKNKKINTVGAGDSMVAGFIAGYKNFNNYEKALKMGVAAGTATANSMFLATEKEIFNFFDILNKEENNENYRFVKKRLY